MKTTKEYFEQLFHMIDEWRPCEREAQEVEALIATIQKEAFSEGRELGRITGVNESMKNILVNGLCFDGIHLKKVKFEVSHLDCCATDQCKVASEVKS